MKRLLSLALALVLLVSMAACGGSAAAPQPTEAPAASPTASPPPEASEPPYGGFAFHTTDRDGREWDHSVFAENKVTMINFWEPWCGPCVGEMGDLERLQQTYGPDLQILGVYSTFGMEPDVDAVLERTGATYPILLYTEDFAVFRTGYVPTTVFFDSDGRIVGPAMKEGSAGLPIYVGSRSFEDWAAVVEALL